MLTTLIIKNFAIIDELEIEFSPGFNVVTGETGAGKSILIGAIQLLLGQRADKSVIRKDSELCEVQGIFEFGRNSPLLITINGYLDKCGVTPDDEGVVIVKRIIKPNSSRIFINSTPVPLGVLAELGIKLVDIHGPYDSQSLVFPSTQLELLDNFAGTIETAQLCGTLYHEMKLIDNEIATLEDLSDSQEQIELLRFQLNEIQQAELKEDEEKELNRRHAITSNSRRILEILDQNNQRLEGDGAILENLSVVMRDFHELDRIEPQIGSTYIQYLEEIMEKIRDLVGELNSFGYTIELDQQEILQIEERLSLIQKLKRKYGGDLQTIMNIAVEIEIRLEKISNLEVSRKKLLEERKKSLSKIIDCAKKMSNNRKLGAKRLSKAIMEKQRDLGFKESSFTIEITETGLSSTGIDQVTYYFAPNPGEGFRSLKDIASSGEISRIMLAIKTVLAKADKTPTLVFDEIDSNIGGTTAVKVGSSLRFLGKERQVLCITHLPQVAAGAEKHFVVEKSYSKGRTMAALNSLKDNDRVYEIARMLGGKESTSVVLKHAEELVKRAKN